MKFTRTLQMCGLLLAAALIALPAQLQAAVRQRCNGLMIRNYVHENDPNPSNNTFRPTFIKSVVIDVKWSELEPSSTIVANDYSAAGWVKIDTAIASITTRLAAQTPPLVPRIRLRIQAGRESPQWAKELDGGDPTLGLPEQPGPGPGAPVTIYHPQDNGVASTIPRFWGHLANINDPNSRVYPYLDAYAALMQRIQAKYGSDTKVCEVVASGAMMRFAEPFTRSADDGFSNQRLWNAGLNYLTDLAAHQRVITIHKNTFPEIRTSLSISVWDIIVGPDSPTYNDSEFFPAVRDFAEWARGQLNARLVLQNNGAGVDANPDCGNPGENHFSYLQSLKIPTPVNTTGFQTRTLARLNCNPAKQLAALKFTLDLCDGMGANFAELPGGIETLFPATETQTSLQLATAALQPYHDAITANP